MEKVTIEIQTINAAFVDNPELEVARILNEIPQKLTDRLYFVEPFPQRFDLRDINGYTTGSIHFE